MLDLLLQLRDNNVCGPVLPAIELPMNTDVDDENPDPIIEMSRWPLSSRCCNYSLQQCSSALDDQTMLENNAPSMLSQDYWYFNETSDEDATNQIAPGSQFHKKRTAKRTNIYEKLNPIFKLLVTAMESTEATFDDVESTTSKKHFKTCSKLKQNSKNASVGNNEIIGLH
jgi:hypothetical protein